MAKVGRGSEQAMIRLPEGMRGKLKEAADQSGRSMNAEIVERLERSFQTPLFIPDTLLERIRVYSERHGRTVQEEVLRLLEKNYPEQWHVDDRMEYLGNLLAVLQGGKADARINRFINDVRETVEGVISGRVKGVTKEVRDDVSALWNEYHERLADDYSDEQVLLDDEEQHTQDLIGRPEKFAEPPPNPRRDLIYLMDILPPEDLAELTKCLSMADTEGASKVITKIAKEDIQKRIARQRASDFNRSDDDEKDQF